MFYPQQNRQRNRLDLSGIWDFQIDPDDEGLDGGWSDGLPNPRPLAVPASWNEQYPDLRDHLGAAWYELRFQVPESWDDQRVVLRFGSVIYRADVWINGTKLGHHEGGHLPFEFEVDGHLRPDVENRLVVRVENELSPTRVPPGNVAGAMSAILGSYPNTNYDFFPYAGIQRPVILYTTPRHYISDLHFQTVQIGEPARVSVSVDVAGAGGRLVFRLLSESETSPLEASAEMNNGDVAVELDVPNARLWSPSAPNLYRLQVDLTDQERVIDRVEIEVGIRTVAVEGDQILLNGEPIYLTGFGRHEDFPISGRGLNLPVLVRDYALLDWIGANSYRTAHYPYSEEEMSMADRQGLLIIDEIPAVGLFFEDSDENVETRLQICRRQISDLIARDKNHPSVIMWSVANEPMPPNMMERMRSPNPPPAPPKTIDFFQNLIDLAHELDPSRPATLVGVMGGPTEWLALSDVVCINRYYGWYTQGGRIEEGMGLLEQELDQLHAKMGKPIIIAEFGADTVAGVHRVPAEMWSEEYQVEVLKAHLDVTDQRPFVVGMHIWNFADFKTGQGILRTAGLNHKGVFTRDRQPKMAAHFLRRRWRKLDQ